MPGEWVDEPQLHVKQEQHQDALPGEEAVETVGARFSQGRSGDVYQENCCHCEDTQLPHKDHFLASNCARSG